MFQIIENTDSQPRVVVLGLGGSGIKYTNRLITNGFSGFETVCADTDAHDLESSLCKTKIALSGPAYIEDELLTRTNPPHINIDTDPISKAISSAKILIIVAGMSGTTGSMASIAIARMAKSLDIIAIASICHPISASIKSLNQARERAAELSKYASVFDFNIQKIAKHSNYDLNVPQAIDSANAVFFEKTDNLIFSLDSIINHPGAINIGINGFCEIFSEPVCATIGHGKGIGPNRANLAVSAALSGALDKKRGAYQSKNVLVIIKSNKNLKMREVDEIIVNVSKTLPDNSDINFGVSIDDKSNIDLSVTVLIADKTKPTSSSDYIDSYNHTPFTYSTNSRISPEIEAKLLKERVADADRKIIELQEKFETASGNEKDRLELQINKEREQRETAEKRLNEAELIAESKDAEISILKAELEGRIQKSIDALRNSMETTDSNIKTHKTWSSTLKTTALSCLSLAVLFLTMIMGSISIPYFPFIVNITGLIKELHQLAFVVTTFPILALLAIGTTLLRHDAKLIQEVRHYTEQKHQIERMAGLLQAAQYAAQDLNKNKNYVEETFTKIRDYLISGSPTITSNENDKIEKQPKDDSGIIGSLKSFKEVLELLKGNPTDK